MMVMTGTVLEETFSSGTFEWPIMTMVDSSPYHSRGSFDWPLHIMEGTGRVSADTDIYRGIVMNLNNQAMSTYTNYPYNSLAYFNGKYLGMRSNGIYELSGDRDGTIQILSRIKTGPIDFGTNLTKYIRDVWITFRSDGHIALVFSVDEDNTTEVEEFTKKASVELREEKIKVPRGLRGRYYTIELKNRSGADFDIDSMSILVDVIGRKR